MKKLSDSYWENFKKIIDDNKEIYDGLKFEELIGELLKILYGHAWNPTKKTHDNNRDFWILLEKEKLWAECKNYKDTIAMDVLAPTLVMAQIYRANTILFFSRSAINPKAKDKILLFGKKTKKKIVFYDANTLENLIIDITPYLPHKYRPQKIHESESKSEDFVSMFFFQDALSGTVLSEDEYMNYRYAERVRYNELFSLAIVVKNPFPLQDATVKISFSPNSHDRFRFQYMNRNISSDKDEWMTAELNPGEGQAFILNLRPIIFAPTLQLPCFEVEICSNNKDKVEWESLPITVTCSWVGQTKLIGIQYEKILDEFENKLLLNKKFSCLLLSGTSGTGKTRTLVEVMGKCLRYGYKVLNLTAAENFSSQYLMREVIYFIYEVPKSLITTILDEKFEQGIHADNDHSDVKKALKMLRILNATKGSLKSNEFVDEYGDIIFEELSNRKYVLVIDNIQFAGKSFQYFLQQYAIYSANQNRTNSSILIGSFNLDYMSSSASNLLFNLLHLNIPHLCSHNVKGFLDVHQGIFFLRELIHTESEAFDSFFEELINKVSLKPYYLYQSIRLLEEAGAIKSLPNRQGYIFTDQNALEVLSQIENGFLDILKKRWKFIEKELKKTEIECIFSILYLFGRIDEKLIESFHLNTESLNFLCEKGLLKITNDKKYDYDHDIVRNFFETNHKSEIFSALIFIKQTKYKFLIIFLYFLKCS